MKTIVSPIFSFLNSRLSRKRKKKQRLDVNKLKQEVLGDINWTEDTKINPEDGPIDVKSKDDILGDEDSVHSSSVSYMSSSFSTSDIDLKVNKNEDKRNYIEHDEHKICSNKIQVDVNARQQSVNVSPQDAYSKNLIFSCSSILSFAKTPTDANKKLLVVNRCKSYSSPNISSSSRASRSTKKRKKAVRKNSVCASENACSNRSIEVTAKMENEGEPGSFIPKPLNKNETITLLLRCSIGTGVLAMPQAFGYSGLLFGLLYTIIIGIIVTYCMEMLIKCKNCLCSFLGVTFLTYSETVRYGVEMGPRWLRPYASYLASFSDVCLICLQIAIGFVYIFFVAENIDRVLSPFVIYPIKINLLFILGPIILLNLFDVRYLSMIGNLMMFSSLTVLGYSMLNCEKIPKKEPIWSPDTFPYFFRNVIFALTSITVVFTLENKICQASFVSLLWSTMGIIITTYVIFGTIGFMYCGSNCCSNVAVDVNYKNMDMNVVFGMLAVAILISHTLHSHATSEILLPKFSKCQLCEEHICHIKYNLRNVLCVLSIAVAFCCPNLGLISYNFSILFIAILIFIFPALVDICIISPNFCLNKFRVCKNTLIFLIGVCGIAIGVISIKGI